MKWSLTQQSTLVFFIDEIQFNSSIIASNFWFCAIKAHISYNAFSRRWRGRHSGGLGVQRINAAKSFCFNLLVISCFDVVNIFFWLTHTAYYVTCNVCFYAEMTSVDIRSYSCIVCFYYIYLLIFRYFIWQTLSFLNY